MAENTELQEAKGLLSKMVAFLSGDKVEAAEEVPVEATEEKTELMEGALEVGEYMLPDGRKLIVSEGGAEIESKETEVEETEVTEEAEMEKEKTEMSSQEDSKVLELSKTIEKLVEANETLVEKVTNLEAAKPLRGAPKQEVKQKKVITPNMSHAQAAAIRLENAGL